MKAIIKSTKTVVKAKPFTASPTTNGDATAKRNRETYLESAIAAFRRLFKDEGKLDIPEVRVSCGFPAGQRGSKKFLGQTWDRAAAKDGLAQIFLSPLIDETIPVLTQLAHELIHATLGNDEGHGPEFSRVARSIGLGGAMRATVATDILEIWMRENIVSQLGEYPHAKLSLDDREKAGVAKQTTRMFKCVCKKTGYLCRVSREWLDKYGPPVSPATKKPMDTDYIMTAAPTSGEKEEAA